MKSAHFSCRLCGIHDDKLPYPQGLDFARMQRHAMEAHGLTLEDLQHSTREEIPGVPAGSSPTVIPGCEGPA